MQISQQLACKKHIKQILGMSIKFYQQNFGSQKKKKKGGGGVGGSNFLSLQHVNGLSIRKNLSELAPKTFGCPMS